MLGALGVVEAGELCVPLSTRGVQGAGPRFESQEAGVREPEGGRPAQCADHPRHQRGRAELGEGSLSSVCRRGLQFSSGKGVLRMGS